MAVIFTIRYEFTAVYKLHTSKPFITADLVKYLEFNRNFVDEYYYSINKIDCNFFDLTFYIIIILKGVDKLLKLLNTYIINDIILKDFYFDRPEICKRNLYSRCFEITKYNNDAYFKFEFKKENLPDAIHHFNLILIIKEYTIVNSAVEATEESRREYMLKQLNKELSSVALKPIEDPRE
jgi:hypothetical protein